MHGREGARVILVRIIKVEGGRQPYRQTPGASRMLYVLLNVHVSEENPSLPISL